MAVNYNGRKKTSKLLRVSIRWKSIFAVIIMFSMLSILFITTFIFTTKSLNLLNLSSKKTFPVLENLDKALAKSEWIGVILGDAFASNDQFAVEDTKRFAALVDQHLISITKLDPKLGTQIQELKILFAGFIECGIDIISDENSRQPHSSGLPHELSQVFEKQKVFLERIKKLRDDIRLKYVCEIDRVADSSEQVTAIGILLILTGAIIGWLVVRFLNGSISSPVVSIANASRRVGEGLYKKVSEHDSHDEIGWLTQNFNQMVENLEANLEEIREKERARTLFFHNTSHELRTPLHGIIGYLQLFKEGKYVKLETKGKMQIDKVLQLVDGLKQQVNLILDLAKAKKGELTINAQDLSL